MTIFALFADADPQGSALQLKEARDVTLTPDTITQSRLGLNTADLLNVKEVNWPEFHIIGDGNQHLVSGKNAQLVVSVFGTADFTATITEHWAATEYLFRVAIYHDQTRLELINSIGKRYRAGCQNNYQMTWSDIFDGRKFEAINSAAILPFGEFGYC